MRVQVQVQVLYLKPAIKTPRNGDTLGGTARVGQGRLQGLYRSLCLLQLLHKGVNSLVVGRWRGGIGFGPIVDSQQQILLG